MRVKSFVTLILASGFDGVAYSFKEKLMSFWTFRRQSQNQESTTSQSLAMAAVTK